jgi:anti-sigma factor RsiW
MTCQDVDDGIEAVLSGDEPATDAFRAHVESCPRCAAAVAAARQIDQLLASATRVRAPADFSSTVLARIRRDRWRSEQQLDRLFNAGLAAGVLLIVAGVLTLVNMSGITTLFSTGAHAVNQAAGRILIDSVPALPTLMAVAFLATAAFVWWWAEQRFSM